MYQDNIAYSTGRHLNINRIDRHQVRESSEAKNRTTLHPNVAFIGHITGSCQLIRERRKMRLLPQRVEWSRVWLPFRSTPSSTPKTNQTENIKMSPRSNRCDKAGPISQRPERTPSNIRIERLSAVRRRIGDLRFGVWGCVRAD
jgi:hypothetical protein